MNVLMSFQPHAAVLFKLGKLRVGLKPRPTHLDGGEDVNVLCFPGRRRSARISVPTRGGAPSEPQEAPV